MPVSTVQFDHVWPELEKSLLSLFNSEAKQVEAIGVYDAVYALCTARPSPMVDCLIGALDCMVVDRIINSQIMPKLLSCTGVEFLISYSQEFTRFVEFARQLDACFTYLNRLLMSNSADFIEVFLGDSRMAPNVLFMTENKKTVRDLLILLWKRHVYNTLKQTLLSSLFFHIRHLRQEETAFVDRNRLVTNSIEAIIQSFVAIDMSTLSEESNKSTFMFDFEQGMLAETQKYYQLVSAHLIKNECIPAYLQKISCIIEREIALCAALFRTDETSPTLDRVCHLCRQELISNHLDSIYPDFVSHVAAENILILRLFYNVLDQVDDALNVVAHDLERHFIESGTVRLKKQDVNEGNLISRFRIMYQKFKSIVDQAFNSSSLFVAAIDKALSEVLKVLSSDYDISLLICKRLNELSRDFNEEHIEEVALIFKFINDKDRFALQYSNDLAQRLLQESSFFENEKLILTRLKVAGGFELMGRVLKMLNDIDLSKMLNSKHRQSNSSTTLNVVVCTSGVWPLKTLGSENSVQLPDFLQRDIDSFTDFYRSCHEGRKLQWLFDYSRVDIRCHGFARRYDISLPLLHAILLLKFSSIETYSPMENELHLVKDLISIGLLVADASSEGLFSINHQFSSNKFKLSFDFTSETRHIAQDSQTGIHDRLNKELENDRQYYIQAQLVRLMKVQKKCSLQEINNLLTAQVKERFVPSYQLIRNSIDILISKQYLEEKEGTIIYLA